MAKYTVTRKSIVNALADQNVLAAIVDVLGADPEEVKPTIRAMVNAANAKRESKPTAETLRNERIMHELVEDHAPRHPAGSRGHLAREVGHQALRAARVHQLG